MPGAITDLGAHKVSHQDSVRALEILRIGNSRPAWKEPQAHFTQSNNLVGDKGDTLARSLWFNYKLKASDACRRVSSEGTGKGVITESFRTPRKEEAE